MCPDGESDLSAGFMPARAGRMKAYPLLLVCPAVPEQLPCKEQGQQAQDS